MREKKAIHKQVSLLFIVYSTPLPNATLTSPPEINVRVLDLARRFLKGVAAAVVPANSDKLPVIIGDSGAAQLDRLANQIRTIGTGVVIENLTTHQDWTIRASGFRWLIGMPFGSLSLGEHTLIILGKEPRRIGPEEQFALAEFSNLLLSTPALTRNDPNWHDVIDGVPDVVIHITSDWHIEYLNPAAAELFGYDIPELIGRAIEDVGRNDPRFAEFLETCLTADSESPTDGQAKRYERLDGTTFYGELTTIPLHNVETNGSDGVVIVIRDVTAGATAEQSLQHKRDQLRTIVDHLPIIVYGLRPNGEIIFLKGKGLLMLNLSKEELVGQNVLTHSLFSEHNWEACLEALREGREQSIRFRYRGKTFNSRNVPVMDPDGSVKEIIGVAIDATEEANAAEALKKSNELAEMARREAEETSRQQSDFLASMSHEIRTPLTGIIGFADILSEEVEGEAQQSARMIQRSGHRLLETLNSVLSLSRLESRQLEANFEELDIYAEASEAARLLQPLAEEKGLVLEITGTPNRCISDSSVFHRIVTNLVANAIKFTDQGKVHVAVRTTERGAAVRVSDTGRGMNPDFIPRLFKPFHRETDHHSGAGGTGLGLTITKKLVDLIGSSIAVETEPGRGTTFTIHIPRIPEGYEPDSEPEWIEFLNTESVQNRFS